VELVEPVELPKDPPVLPLALPDDAPLDVALRPDEVVADGPPLAPPLAVDPCRQVSQAFESPETGTIDVA
jgi:hypothetical protein